MLSGQHPLKVKSIVPLAKLTNKTLAG